MRITVVTIFPEMFASVVAASLLGKAAQAGILAVDFVDPRDFAADRHRTVDDTPYGGGPGMVMKVETMVAALEAIASDGPGPHRILLTPRGAPLVERRVRELAAMRHLVLVCGRYEGIDERVVELVIDEEISLGDFVLSGGELAAMVVIEAVARHVPGVLGQPTSTEEESFSALLLEYPQYTRPPEFRGRKVPPVLLSGHHDKIRAWRRQCSLAQTAARRPELLRRSAAVAADEAIRELAARTYVVLAHYPVLDRTGRVVTSSVTNLDIHDLARSSATYGLGGVYAVTPITVQREKVEHIVAAWPRRVGDASCDHRAAALALVSTAPSIESALADMAERHGGQAPHVVATSARARIGSQVPVTGFDQLFAASLARVPQPLALLFGTGWGLSEQAIAICDQILIPIKGRGRFNHLSVRGAVAIALDRLFAAPS